MARMRDLRAEAEAQAQRIMDYWAARGFHVTAWVEERPFHIRMRSRRYEVHTDMVGGLPTQKLKAAAA